jgi:hypothetical protein
MESVEEDGNLLARQDRARAKTTLVRQLILNNTRVSKAQSRILDLQVFGDARHIKASIKASI